MEGFIIKIYPDNNSIDTTKLKEIKDIIDTQPWFTPNMYATAKWMADFYMCSLGETMRLFIPGKNSVKIRPVFNINDENITLENWQKLSDKQQALYKYMQAYKDVDLLTLRRSFGSNENFIFDLEKLINKNYIIKSYIYHKQAKKIYTDYIILNTLVNDDILATLKRKPAQKKALIYLNEIKEASVTDLKQQHISLTTLKALAQLNYVKIEKKQVLRDSYKNMLVNKAQQRTLTEEQQTAMNTIEKSLSQGKNKFLLFGVTGSGKTQIYIEMALKTLR